MTTRCTVLIGHVDHGKTTLVRALTGMETDRLPEEKRRGLSITPGFAHKAYPNGTIDFVDAPGHADFITAMVGAAAGAQAALVVVSLAEGVGAQTREHMHIAGLLGITQAVVALTKADLVPPPDQPNRISEIRTALSRTPFADAPLVVCSAQTGEGITALHSALDATLQQAPTLPAPLHSFLPVDRAFSLEGHGTIVTGTLLGRALTVDTPMTLLPGGQDVTLRGLQSRGAARDVIQAGERTAVNLRGVAIADIPRGAVLCAKGTALPSLCCDVHLRLPPAQGKPLKHMQEIRVVFGTTSEVAQLRLFKNAGNFAQLRFKKPVVCFAGQPAILRRLSPSETSGGAEFLDPQSQPTKPSDQGRVHLLHAAQQQDVKGIATALAATCGGVAKITHIARLARLDPARTRVALGDGFVELAAGLVCSQSDIKTAKHSALSALTAYHTQHPLRPLAPRATIAPRDTARALVAHVETALLAGGRIRKHDNALALATHDPIAQLSVAQHATMTAIEDRFRAMGLAAPTAGTLDQTAEEADLCQLLVDTGALIPLRNIALKQTLVLHKDTIAAAATTLATAFPAPRPFTPSQARTALSTSRRVIVPLLEHFDSTGTTLREGDTRRMTPANPVPPSHAVC